MAQFFGRSFMWKGIPSETYGLYILNLESSGIYDSSNGSELQIYKKQIIRKPVPYTFGFSQSPVLEFDLEFGSATQLSAIDRDLIGRWLFGQQNYDKLQIFQDDMDQVYFNCVMTQSTKRSVGNLSYVFKAHVVCDAPWAWTFPKTYTFTYGNNVVVADYTFLNDSANSDYIYPQLNFTLNSAGTYFTLVNKTDSNRTFQFTGLNNGETIQVDNDRQIIVSSVPYAHRLSNFIGYKWFRLLPGVNLLSINAAIGTFSITYNLARKIGG